MGFLRPLTGDMAADKILSLSDILLLLLPFFKTALIALDALAGVGAVIAAIRFEHTKSHSPRAIADRIEEIAIMRYDDQTALENLQKTLKPFDRNQIQMIGRFIEQQKLRIFQ